jgi:hypothetical protein
MSRPFVLQWPGSASLIGVISRADQLEAVWEFFELFKTPWEVWRPGSTCEVVIVTTDEIPETNAKLLVVFGSASKSADARLEITGEDHCQNAFLDTDGDPIPVYAGLITFAGGQGVCCLTAGSKSAGLQIAGPGATTIRLGYDVFDEVRFLLSEGQPPENAHIPTLDMHVRMLREWILQAGVPLLEVPPVPSGHGFAVCLTHDIDFVGIRRHRLDHSVWGFVFRATVGGLRGLAGGRLSLGNVLRSWLAVASLPLVYAGWIRDFWEPFEWYLQVEKNLSPTYFLIPFKKRRGAKVPGKHPARRATAYDIGDILPEVSTLRRHGCEVGVHGIDSWHDVERGKEELAAVAKATGGGSIGVRMHWLLRDSNTPTVLEQSEYAYDSTFGYNEAVGYRAGTGQVFRPLNARTLLELPLHIQDGALFYPQRMNLSDAEAETRCQRLIDHARSFGGVLTVLWHDRSHGPERFWGSFYVRLIGALKSLNVWFGTAGQVVDWFQKRRAIRFEPTGTSGQIRPIYNGGEFNPPVVVRYYRPELGGIEIIDIPWNGKSATDLENKMTIRLSPDLSSLTHGSTS